MPLSASEASIEAELQTKGLNAPRLTKAIAYQGKPRRAPSGAAKKSVIRKKAKSAINRGLVSEKAAKRHLGEL